MGVDQLVTGGDFDAPVVDSLTTDEVTIGGTGPVTGTFGDSGEYIPVETIGYISSATTTSTTDDALITNAGALRTDLDKLSVTGFDSYHVSWAARVDNDTNGEDVTLSVAFFGGGNRNGPYAEETITDPSNDDVSSSLPADISTVTGIPHPTLQAKVTGGTASIDTHIIRIWGRIA